MRACQREYRLRMIEGRRLPRGSGVARFAELRVARFHVVWVRGLVVVRQVTAHALGRSTGEFIVDMALRALHWDMRPGQRELRGGIVIEFRTRPGRRRMARRAILREFSGRMVGIRGLVEVRQVAARALSRQRFEVVVHVA